jgi:hypothetical protein
MKNHPFFFKMLDILLPILILIASGCNLIPQGGESVNEIALIQTQDALELTRVALDNLAAATTQQQPAIINTLPATDITPLPTDTLPPPDVNYEGISFSFDDSLASNALSSTIPGQNLGPETMPSNNYPSYYEFTFNGFAISDHFYTPIIRIYPVDDYIAISQYAADEINGLKNALVQLPAGGSMGELPFLPLVNAAQVFSSNVRYFNFQNGSGVRYLTMYAQAAYPVDNQNLFYTYQGLTQDGRFYIAATFPVTHNSLPNDGSTEVEDWLYFDENFLGYIDDMVMWLNGQSSEQFSPNLALLDEAIASMLINR